jgi:hypothetical protein
MSEMGEYQRGRTLDTNDKSISPRKSKRKFEEAIKNDCPARTYFLSICKRLASLIYIFEDCSFGLQELIPFFQDYERQVFQMKLPLLLKECPFFEEMDNGLFKFDQSKLEIFLFEISNDDEDAAQNLKQKMRRLEVFIMDGVFVPKDLFVGTILPDADVEFHEIPDENKEGILCENKVYKWFRDVIGPILKFDPISFECWKSNAKYYFIDPEKIYREEEKDIFNSLGADFHFTKDGKDLFVEVKFSREGKSFKCSSNEMSLARKQRSK